MALITKVKGLYEVFVPPIAKQGVDKSLNANNPLALLKTLQELRAEVFTEGQATFAKWRPAIERRSFLISSLNFAYYLAFRRRDLRDLQAQLIPLGLSSLGRSESHVLETLDAVIAALTAICDQPDVQPPSVRAFYRGARQLDHNTNTVLGAPPPHRRVRIMVTLPTEAATDADLVSDLVKRGMDWARINCAHDDADGWTKMIEHVRQTEHVDGRRCRILMDLGGPKVRTGVVIAPHHANLLFKDDQLLLTQAEPVKGKAKKSDKGKAASIRFKAQCLIPEVFAQMKVGDAVWIDDGHLGAQVEQIVPEGAILRVTYANTEGYKLRSGKGLNFPDTALELASLTDKDRDDLLFVMAHADAVGYSFVQTADDVAQLQDLIRQHSAIRQQAQPNAPPLAIVAKIETKKAVENLPDIIVQAAGQQPFGVMIARGDLAVEVGYERMAEIQEEMLWLCEAAHVPVIWATQVLEQFVKEGIPSRAEMTDAAMSERAECVMLNKGPFVADAVTILDDVLMRMQAHQSKKTPQLRALHSW